MNTTTKASLLWGIIAGLSFLVLVQGYHLLGGERITIGVMVAIAILVGLIAVVLSHLAGGNLSRMSR